MTGQKYSAEELLGPLNDVERKNAPPWLFVAGDPEILRRGARVAVVGTRKPSSAAQVTAKNLAVDLARRGIVVVSGLAEGIDTVAHREAMGVGGRSIAVLGTPLDQYFPPENRRLQEQMMSEQVVITQFPIGAPVQRGNFPIRNRTMALVSDATIIVEAGAKSGTIHQGWEALRLGRPLLLMEAHCAGAAWSDELVRYGAQRLTLSDITALDDFLPERSGVEPPSLAL